MTTTLTTTFCEKLKKGASFSLYVKKKKETSYNRDPCFAFLGATPINFTGKPAPFTPRLYYPLAAGTLCLCLCVRVFSRDTTVVGDESGRWPDASRDTPREV